ncbi:RNB domain-containing ribonuclease [Glycomyces sp. TRM65418]|uniref:RNB domain-containing ribonuclease n=1 Tax=Glycomyces sp. TRM65418 TaxID=2867006 RepID=UPI001CE539E7|nr:RNB domain-containing ribonuclease [Glycomyces sp. TRM65418]MCC3761550.1 RNB domain-containing ribonuclease [Glycomyces sp. TRM65418]QZD55647.1 RNB domain-containing ribonuclease [Glycomyces sp. TRM65418]
MADYNPAETGIMIDAATTVDRDDAIWIEADGDGFDVWVHIARVADHVRTGGRADTEAHRRVHTRYRTDHTKHMLPAPVVEAASLEPDRANDTFVVHLRLDAAGRVITAEIGPGRLTRSWAMAHGEAAAAAGDPAHPLHGTLALALRFAQTMLAARRNAGALAFYDLLSGFATNEEGQLVRLDSAERNSGYIIVQEFMIAANAQIAAWAVSRDLPILFRNHRLAAVAGDPAELRDELDSIAATGDNAAFEMLRTRMRMIARAATYAPTVHGHHGLQLPAYTHATSPIRRYPDLVTQRILLAAALGHPSPYAFDDLSAIATHVNERVEEERRAKAEYFKQKAHEQTARQMEAADFAALPYKQFARVLQYAIERGETPAGLAEDAARRFDRRELQLREFASVYLYGQGEFAPLRERMNRQLAREPQQAQSIVNVYLQDRLGGPVSNDTHVRWTVEDAPGYEGPLFAAQVAIHCDGEAIESPKRLQRSKKDARNQAALALVAHLAGLPDPSGDADAAPRAEPSRKLLVDAAVNPAEAVQIYAARGVVERLAWDFTTEGPAHERTFICRAEGRMRGTGDAVAAEGTGPTKQASKIAAALELRVQIEVALALGQTGRPANA